MKKVAVLGAGLVGRAIALDLASEFAVTAVDIRDQALQPLRERGIATEAADLSNPDAVSRLAAGVDLVVSAVPGHLGFATLKAVLEAGRDVVDIAFFPEDSLALEELARERRAMAIVDCGVAPGMSNLLAAHAASQMERALSLSIYVGGLPVVRQGPYEYKAVFSPADVIEEYLRPARLMEKGEVVVRPALSELELIDFPPLGTLEAFNTDGLRTLLRTLPIPEMHEKTLRYPGYAEKIALLRDSGFFSAEPVAVGEARVRPIDLTSRLLFPLWELKPGEEDLTVMRIQVEGIQGGRPVVYRTELFDRYDPASGVHSMARTTGYTATAAVRLVAAGLYRREGVSPTEYIGRCPECVDFMLKTLADRGVIYRQHIKES